MRQHAAQPQRSSVDWRPSARSIGFLKWKTRLTDEEVVIAMRRALRAKRARPRQALGLTRDLRDQLIAACPNCLAGKRDRAMIALGYDTLCRRAELVGLRVEDMAPSSSGSAQILIRRSKNDPYGLGRLGYISPETMELVRAWLTAAKIDSGYIFRAAQGDLLAAARCIPMPSIGFSSERPEPPVFPIGPLNICPVIQCVWAPRKT